MNFGRPIVTNKDFATRLFPSYFGQDLLIYCLLIGRAGYTLGFATHFIYSIFDYER